MMKLYKYIKSLFTPTPNPYIGRFRGWNATRYRASSPDGVFSLWIGNGFSYFEDDTIAPGKRRLICPELDHKTKRLLYNALMHDLQQDALQILEDERFEVVER